MKALCGPDHEGLFSCVDVKCGRAPRRRWLRTALAHCVSTRRGCRRDYRRALGAPKWRGVYR